MYYYKGPLKTVVTKYGSKPTTKYCPLCNNVDLVLLKEFNQKVCTAHKEFVVIPWYCDEGQPKLQ